MSAERQDSEVLSFLHRVHAGHKRSRHLIIATVRSLLVLGGIGIVVTIVLRGRLGTGKTVLFSILEAVGTIGLCLLFGSSSNAILDAITRRKINSLAARFHKDKQTLLEAACLDPEISKNEIFLTVIDKVGGRFRYRSNKMQESTKEKLVYAFMSWNGVVEACGNPPREGTQEILGMAFLWQAIVHLVCAERTKTVRKVAQGVETKSSPEGLLWVASARQSMECADKALQYLGPAAAEIVTNIVERAREQEQISQEEAAKDPRYKSIYRSATGGLIFSGSVALDYEDALIMCDLNFGDLMECTRSLHGHEILTKWVSVRTSESQN